MASDLRSSFDTNDQEISSDILRIPYLQAFLNDKPKQSFDAIQHRLRGVKVLYQEIADYFKERMIIEDNYVKSLQRLANKTFVTDRSHLCAFESVWDTLFNELQEIITMRSHYITKVTKEVETPLREKITEPTLLQLKQEEINIGKLTKEYEERLAKMNKQRIKTEKLSGKKAETSESKLAEAQNAFNQKKEEWQTEWTKYLEKSQIVDFTRWVNIKEALMLFETLQVESFQKGIEMTERNLSKIMEFDAENEIFEFCSRKIKATEGNSSDELNLSLPTHSHFRSAFGTVRRRKMSSYIAENTQPQKIDNEDIHNELKSSSNTAFNTPNEGSSFTEISVPKVLIDSEGYSIPRTSNDDIDSDAFSDGTGSFSVSQEKTLRVEIKPISTEVNEADDAAAMSLVVTALKSAPTIKNRTPRGRRDRNTIYGSEGSNLDSSASSHRSSERQKSFTLPSPSISEFSEVISHPRAMSDSEIHSYGLRVSITETINVISRGGGEIKLLVTGDISISYNRPSVNDISTPIRIKINNFDVIEKSAPNQSYLREVPGSVGSYDIDTGMLSLAGDIPVAVMKYQLHIDSENTNAYIPLQITPHWKCEPNQLALVIVYQANNKCKLSGTLTDLSFIIPVAGEVESVQSKPTGLWNTEKQMMYWQVDDLDLAVPSEQNKLLARFVTGQMSHPAPAAVKFTCKGQLLSAISLEIDQTNIKDQNVFDNPKLQEVECQVVSGKFIVSP
ncbi:10315_t:CDS:10 [Acaulospora morrowiae]|uniref:10315_t:CDS:1 n=1 Tax=Acaulospora morrowiae TaxID=94023 RepID=A0A9N9AG01_9GLOM|nr:10315_t:CDS:10 [Acaulospora morrowiae]